MKNLYKGMPINNSENDNKNIKNLLLYSLGSLFPKKKLAFTLAEVLITLGIIGIVAAMTIPTLINKKQKAEIETQLKENYSIIQQSLKMAENDDIAIDSYLAENIESVKSWFYTNLAPYMKYSHVCFNAEGCWQSMGPTKTLAGSVARYNQTNIGVGYNIVTIKLNNGANVSFDSYGTNDIKTLLGRNCTYEDKALGIFIDVNGDRKPNIIGKDIYVAVWTDKGLLPAGIDETEATVDSNCSATANTINAGYYCLLKVKNNGWKIPDDVWNKKI